MRIDIEAWIQAEEEKEKQDQLDQAWKEWQHGYECPCCQQSHVVEWPQN